MEDTICQCHKEIGIFQTCNAKSHEVYDHLFVDKNVSRKAEDKRSLGFLVEVSCFQGYPMRIS